MIKFLVTSRPYFEIGERLTRLSGENQQQARMIACEIDIIIRSGIDRTHRLEKKEKHVFQGKLTEMGNRTYLWVYFIFDEIEKNGVFLSQERIRSFLDKIPRTVNEAYDRMSLKSRDIWLAEMFFILYWRRCGRSRCRR